ncbi:MAG: HAMP domain-containing sensor histidine kinase [Candidatus Dormibacter sp.]
MIRRARRRLLLGNLVVLIALTAVIAAAIATVAVQLFEQDARARLSADAGRAASDLQGTGDTDFAAEHSLTTSGTFYVVWGADGTSTFDPAMVAGLPALMADAARARTGGAVAVDRVQTPAGPALIDTRFVTAPGRQEVLQTGVSLATVEAAERRVVLAAAVTAGVAALLSVGAAILLTRRAIGPIAAALDRERQLIAAASHELRTPLAHASAALQVVRRHPDHTIAAEDEVLTTVTEELARMARLTEGLLQRARGALPPQRTEVVDVDVVTRQVVDAASPRARETDHPLTLRAGGAGVVRADPDQLQQALLAVLDNALTHTAPAVAVEVHTHQDGGAAVVEIADGGAGIPVSDRERAFEPFVRLTPGRSSRGAGLGLSVAQTIVEALRGTVELRDNNPGLRVRIRLPHAPPDNATPPP